VRRKVRPARPTRRMPLLGRHRNFVETPLAPWCGPLTAGWIAALCAATIWC